MNDKLKINKEYKEFIKGQYKFCTKPELEILLIIVENKLNAFEKTKSKIKPKEFCKKYVSFNNQKYDNQLNSLLIILQIELIYLFIVLKNIIGLIRNTKVMKAIFTIY